MINLQQIDLLVCPKCDYFYADTDFSYCPWCGSELENHDKVYVLKDVKSDEC